MANYPASLPSVAPATHGAVNDEIVAIGTELGSNPRGYASSLADRLNAVQKTTALRTFHTALADRLYNPVKIVALGSSTIEGSGVTTYGRHLVNRLGTNLRERFPTPGVAGGWGMIPPAQASATSNYPAVLSGGAAFDSTQALGWGARTVPLSAAGHTITYTLPSITSMQVVYGQFSGGGSFSYSVDGGAAVTVDTNNVTLDRFKLTASTSVTRGSHTVAIAWVSGTTYIRGVIAYDQDETSGIRHYNGGRAGYTSTQYLNLEPQYSYGLVAINPHLILIDIGRNDYTTSPQISPATTKSNVQSMITKARASTTTSPSFVLYDSQRLVTSSFTDSTSARWSDYRAQFAAIAAADTGVTLFDLSLRHLEPAVDNALGLYNTDLIHLTDKGHNGVADLMVDFLAPTL